MHTIALVIIALALLPLAIEVFFGLVIPILKYIALALLIIGGPIFAVIYWKEVGQLILIILFLGLFSYVLFFVREKVIHSRIMLQFIRLICYMVALLILSISLTLFYLWTFNPKYPDGLVVGSILLLGMSYFIWVAHYLNEKYIKVLDRK